MRNLKILLTFFSLAFLMTAPAAFGQFEETDEDKPRKASGGWGYFSIGAAQPDFSGLNTSLADMNLPDFEGNALVMGGGGFLVVSNFLIGGEGQSLRQMEVRNGNSMAQLGGGWGAFQVGYAPISTDWGLIIYPRVGIGAYNYQLFLKDAANPVSFNDIANAPGTASQLEKKGLMLTADLGINYSFAYKEGRGGGVFLGVDIGYNYVPNASQWTMYGEEVANGPDLDMSGLFVRLKIGGAGWHRQ